MREETGESLWETRANVRGNGGKYKDDNARKKNSKEIKRNKIQRHI